MARQTAAEKRAVAEALAVTALTPQDAHNLLVLLDRVQTTGHQEATLFAILAQKLKVIKGSYTGDTGGEDSTSTG